MITTVADVIALVDRHFPFAGAESWDAVGLVVGHPDAPVTRVHCTVDVTDAVIDEAEAVGADMIIAHHPLLLRGITSVRADQPKGRLTTRLVRADLALLTAHTNADTPPDGTAAVLADQLGLLDPTPLRPTVFPARDKITTFVPGDHLERVVDALADAGAGAIGAYDRCAYQVEGTGRFRPLPGANPFQGTVGAVEHVAETRVEMIMDRSRRAAVVGALRAAHPYEIPAFDVVELVPTEPAVVGLGRVGELAAPTTVAGFVATVRRVLPPTGGGVRVAGDPDRPVHRVAVQAGAGDDLFDEARSSGADLYLTSDLRHHPASEALAHEHAPALVDVSHWAAESRWLPTLATMIEVELGLDATVSEVDTDPWRR